MKKFIDAYGAGRYTVERGDNLFQALARSIVYQQLSGKAAGTIHGRFEQLFAGARPSELATLAMSHETLRGAGLSRAKALAIHDLAVRSDAGDLPSKRQLSRMSDEEAISRISEVRGIGPWTVQMHLIFQLGRPDVMPSTDLGVQKGVQAIYGLDQLPTPDDVRQSTGHLEPFRSVAAWYFWRAADAKAN